MKLSAKQLIKERRSASNFEEDIKMTEHDFEQIFELVKYAPSAFNLQHTHYVVVQNAETKLALKEAAFGQHKVGTASATIVVLGDRLAYQQAADIYEGLVNLNILSKQEFDHTIQSINQLYESRGSQFLTEEAIRNASLSAMLFMIAAKEHRWDTCPMIGFDPTQVKKILQLEDRYEPVLLITIGKEKLSSRSPRGYRKPVREFVTFT
ncbi:nitroreductase family protein [Bacillus sp. SCS-151]|uniref:nitroreductase family protein n=1 Tax=Bacillaceae TaxID=186817 RepID=UPI00397AAFFC